MKIESAAKTKTVDIITFMLVGGVSFPVVLDKAAGDYAEDFLDCFKFHLVPKPSLTDPEVKTPEETIAVYKNKILYQSHVKREVELLDPEQQKDLITYLRKLAKEGNRK